MVHISTFKKKSALLHSKQFAIRVLMSNRVSKQIVQDHFFKRHIMRMNARYGKSFLIAVESGIFGEVIRIQSGNKHVLLLKRHLNYVEQMIEHFDFYFDATEPVQIGNDLIQNFCGPRIHRLRDGNYMHFSAVVEGSETNKTYLEYANLKPGEVVWDLGAYCGGTVVDFSKLVGPTGHIYAFEPDDLNHSLLLLNIKARKVKNVTVFKEGIFDQSGEISFSSEGNMTSLIIEKDRGFDLKTIKVVTLDQVLGREEVRPPDFVKMDIEGAEYKSLFACESVLKKIRPRWMLEVHHDSNFNLDIQSITNHFKNCGYKTEIVEQTEGNVLPLVYAEPFK